MNRQTAKAYIQWLDAKANKISGEANRLTFQLVVHYPPKKVKGYPDGFTCYSELNLIFDQAKQVIEKYSTQGILDKELASVTEPDSGNDAQARARLEVFKAFFRAAIKTVYQKVFLTSVSDYSVRRYVEVATAGIFPQRFMAGFSYETLKPGKGEKGYAAYQTALVEKARKLWLAKLRFTCPELQEKDYYITPKLSSGERLKVVPLSEDEQKKFYGALMELFGVGEKDKPLADIEGKIHTVKETKKGKYTPEPHEVSLAETMIAVAQGTNYISIVRFIKEVDKNGKEIGNAATGGFNTPKSSYTIIGFNQKSFEEYTKSYWLRYKNKKVTYDFWDTFIHEVLHVYPLYKSEYYESGGFLSKPSTEKSAYKYWYYGRSPDKDVETFRQAGKDAFMGYTEFDLSDEEQRMWFEESVELQLGYYAQSDKPIDPFLAQTIKKYVEMAPTLKHQGEEFKQTIKDMISHQVDLILQGERKIAELEDWQTLKACIEPFGEEPLDFFYVELKAAVAKYAEDCMNYVGIEVWKDIREIANLGNQEVKDLFKAKVIEWFNERTREETTPEWWRDAKKFWERCGLTSQEFDLSQRLQDRLQELYVQGRIIPGHPAQGSKEWIDDWRDTAKEFPDVTFPIKDSK